MLINLLISFVGIGVIFVILLLAGLLYKRMLITVETVSAGCVDGHCVCPTTSTISPFETFYHDGKRVNPKNYTIKKVDGDCMMPRGINAGDLLFIENFDKQNISSLNIGDILYIYHEKGNFYKIREYRGFKDDENFNTLYYTREGKAKDSVHNINNVKGVVKMKFTA